MAKLEKPSTPIVNSTHVSTEPVAGAVKYKLFKIQFRISGQKEYYYGFSDGTILVTSDGQAFKISVLDST